MQEGFNPSGQAVLEVAEAELTAGGNQFEVISWEVNRALQGTIPYGVAIVGGGITSATGSARLAAVEDTTSQLVPPAALGSKLLPASGQDMTLEAGYALGKNRLFTGKISEVSGGTGFPTVDFVDVASRLSVPITLEPMVSLRHGPTEARNRLFGLRQESIVNRCFRAGGFWISPPPTGVLVVDAPLQGDLENLAATNTLMEATPYDQSAAFRVSGGGGDTSGLGMADFQATWGNLPSRSTPAINAASGAFALSFEASPHRNQAAALTAIFGGTPISLTVYPQSAEVTVAGSPVAAIGNLGVGKSERFLATFTPAGGLTLQAANREGEIIATATGTFSAPQDPLTQVKAYAQPGTLVRAIQAGWPQTPQQALTYTKTAEIVVGHAVNGLACFDGAQGEEALALLNEISGAICAGFWIDEKAVAHWVHSDVLRAKPGFAKEITAEDDLLSLSWVDALSAARSKVVVSGENPKIIYGTAGSTLTLWRGSGESLSPGGVALHKVAPPADETWFDVAEPQLMTSPASYQQGKGSFFGAFAEKEEGAGWGKNEVAKYWRQTGVQEWFLKVTNQLSSFSVAQKVPPGKGFYPWFEGQNLPVVRGRIKALWIEEEVTSTVTGDSSKQPYIHRVGRWVTGEDRLRLANFLAQQLTSGIPEIRDVAIIPDTRLQLGDKVRITDKSLSNISAVGFVVGISISGRPGAISMKISVRVISVSAAEVTYEIDELRNLGRTYAAVEGLYSSETYESQEALVHRA